MTPPQPVRVTLTPEHHERAQRLGRQQRAWAVAHGAAWKWGQNERADNVIGHHVDGYLGEIAVEHHLHLPMNTNPARRKHGDVGPYEVRASQYAEGELILHDDDPGPWPYIYVSLIPGLRKGDTRHPPTDALVVGWAWKSDLLPGREDWVPRMRCYTIPLHRLRDLATLPPPKSLPPRGNRP